MNSNKSTDNNELSDDQQSEEESDIESKSQRKRIAHQITDLAAQLVAMKPKPLARMPIEPSTLEAIRHCAEIKAHGARKRQLHYVSKLLRTADNIDELQAMVDNPEKVPSKKAAANPHKDFRDSLLDDFAGQIDALRENYPDVDLQRVRQLVRNAQKECQLKDPDSEQTIKIEKTKASKSLLLLLSGHK